MTDPKTLRALLAKMTPGPFTYRRGIPEQEVPPHCVRVYNDDQGRRCTAFPVVCDSATEPNEANAEGLCALRNDAEDLLTAYETLAQIKEMRERIQAVIDCALSLAGHCSQWCGRSGHTADCPVPTLSKLLALLGAEPEGR